MGDLRYLGSRVLCLDGSDPIAMCRFCEHVDDKIAVLTYRRDTMICQDTGKQRDPRKAYWRKYYRKNRKKKLAAANERARALKAQDFVG